MGAISRPPQGASNPRTRDRRVRRPSTTWIADNLLTHPSATLTTIDPFALGTERQFRQNLSLSVRRGQVRLIKRSSLHALAEMLGGSSIDEFDVAYVDGNHSASGALQDSVLAFSLLAHGGILIIDDYSGFDTVRLAVDSFLKCNAEDLQVLYAGAQVVVRKTNGSITDDSLGEVLRDISPSADAIRLAGNRLRSPAIRILASHFRGLQKLDVSWNELGREGSAAIGEGLQSLLALDIGGNEIGPEGMREITTRLSRLTHLSAVANELGDAGAEAIAAGLRNLNSLELGFNRITDVGARALAAGLQELRVLGLGVNQLTDAGAEALATGLQKLRTLRLEGNKMTASGAELIATHLPELTELDVGWNAVGNDGLRHIVRKLPRLTALGAVDCGLDDQGAFELAERSRALVSLDIRFNAVGEAGLRELVQRVSSLRVLSARGNPIRDDVAKWAQAELSKREGGVFQW